MAETDTEIMRRVKRESETEQWVRDQDAHEIVDALHQLEDEVEKLQNQNADLLEALEGLLPVAQEFERQSAHGPGGGRGYVVFNKARAAIAKARGD